MLQRRKSGPLETHKLHFVAVKLITSKRLKKRRRCSRCPRRCYDMRFLHCLQILYHKKAHRKFAVCVTCGKITRRTRTYKTHQDYSRSEVKFDVHRVDNMRIQSIALS
ncbi:unnamed protein product [Caenorhabditis nigoni]